MRSTKEIIQDAIDELEHHCGSSNCDCWDADTIVLINELCELRENSDNAQNPPLQNCVVW